MGEDKPPCGECGYKESSPRHGPVVGCLAKDGCAAPEEHHPYTDHRHLIEPGTVHVYVGKELSDSPRSFVGARGFCHECSKRFDYMLFDESTWPLHALRGITDA